MSGASTMYISVSEELREYLKKSKYRDYSTIEKIEVDEVYRSVIKHTKRAKQRVEVSKLIENCTIIERGSAPSEPLTEIELMRRRAEEKRYQRMVSSVLKTGNPAGVGSDVKSASESISFASHFILAFAGAFLCGYYFAEYFLLAEKSEIKIICGGVFSFITLIVESVLFIVREEKSERKSKESRPIPGPPRRAESTASTTDIPVSVEAQPSRYLRRRN
jgi:hypothetical protein